MKNCYLDSHLLALPPDATNSYLENYLLKIFEIAEIAKSPEINLILHLQDQMTLYEENLLPSNESLANILSGLNVTHIPSDSILTIIYFLFTRAKYIESEIKMEDILFNSVTFQPSVALLKRSNKMQNSLQRFLTCISLYKRIPDSLNDSFFISDLYHGTIFHRVTIQIIETEHSFLKALLFPLSIQDYFYLSDDTSVIKKYTSPSIPTRVFEASPKHSKGRPNLEDGNSTLLCTNSQAQEFLNFAIGESSDLDSRLFAFDKARHMFLIFHRTLGNIYHGFHVNYDCDRVPYSIKKNLMYQEDFID